MGAHGAAETSYFEGCSSRIFLKPVFQKFGMILLNVPGGLNLSKEHPECPLSNPNACKEADNPKYCALVRKDKTCLRELSKKPKKPKTGKN